MTTRVTLIHTSDPYTKLVSGDTGLLIARERDPWGSTIVHVKWDDGSTLSLIGGEDSWSESELPDF